jgi:O-antigen ligase
MNRLLVLLLMLLVALSPLPLGSNREWSWALCSLAAAGLTLLWLLTRGWRAGETMRVAHPAIPLLFLLVCIWVLIQAAILVPAGWQHPIWAQTGGVLGRELPGRITLAAEDSYTSLMRLLGYALIFFLTFQLARDRGRARAMLGWLVAAGLVYAVFGLAVFWSDYSPGWLFGNGDQSPDLRSTFVNRNHFATWQGLTLLCAIVWLHLLMARPATRPYTLPDDRAASAERWVLQAWLPLTTILLMATALILTHSRGGFLATLVAVVVLLWLLESRMPVKRVRARLAVMAALAVGGLAFYLSSEVLLKRIERTDITNEGRLVVYENVRHGISENPWLGFGYGTFADSFRLYDRIEAPVHFDRAHNTWLENLFELGILPALMLFAAIGGLTITCIHGVRKRRRDWAYPALGAAAGILAGVHALFDFSLQIPAIAILYACILGIGCAQSASSRG